MANQNWFCFFASKKNAIKIYGFQLSIIGKNMGLQEIKNLLQYLIILSSTLLLEIQWVLYLSEEAH